MFYLSTKHLRPSAETLPTCRNSVIENSTTYAITYMFTIHNNRDAASYLNDATAAEQLPTTLHNGTRHRTVQRVT